MGQSDDCQTPHCVDACKLLPLRRRPLNLLPPHRCPASAALAGVSQGNRRLTEEMMRPWKSLPPGSSSLAISAA